MIFTHSWNERRLRKQITRQIRKKQSKSQFKRLFIIALILFCLFILYTKLTANKNNQLSIYRHQDLETTLHNKSILDAKQIFTDTKFESKPKIQLKEKTTESNTKNNIENIS